MNDKYNSAADKIEAIIDQYGHINGEETDRATLLTILREALERISPPPRQRRRVVSDSYTSGCVGCGFPGLVGHYDYCPVLAREAWGNTDKLLKLEYKEEAKISSRG